MSKITLRSVLIMLAGLLGGVAHAQETVTQPTVLAVTGSALNWIGGASVSVVGSTPLSSTSNGQPAAGNSSAAEIILISAGNAVVNSTGALLNTVAKALTDASNNAGNPTVKASEVISVVSASENKGTPVTPIDPSINFSPAA